MVNFRQSSFRRILVSKILLLSVPILLIGEFVVYQKARSSLIESARRNLTETAIIKGENILNTIDMLGSNLLIASQTTVLQSGEPESVEKFVTQLAQELPRQIKCIQLTNPDDGKIIAGNCDEELTNLNNFLFDQKKVQIEPILPKMLSANSLKEQSLKLHLNLSSPVYDTQGKLRYILSMQSQLLHEKLNRILVF
ncbi:MAG: hypothetical protein HC907_35665 [Richelia sp. SM1_7_0]|nr:hypothetical protein [Richelia sp. SM1_7_0]